MTSIKKLILSTLVLLFSSLAFGQWAKISGDFRDRIEDIYVEGSTVYMATRGGIYLSNDNGVTWNDITPDLNESLVNDRNGGGEGIFSLVKSGTDLYVGSANIDDGLIHKSTDDGNSWELLTGLPGNSNSFPALGTNDTSIYAGSNGSGFFSSGNGGASWAVSDMGLPYANVFSILYDSGAIYCGVSHGSYDILKSTDGGSNWVNLTNGTINVGFVHDIKKYENTILATTNGLGLIRSLDDGISWDTVDIDLGFPNSAWTNSLYVSDTAFFVATISGRIYKSIDDGETWMNISGSLPEVDMLEVAVSGETILAGSASGLYYSNDNGVTWNPSTSGISSSDITVVESRLSDLFFGTSNMGAYYSSDAGASWNDVTGDLSSYYVKDILKTSTDLWIATGSQGSQSGGLFKSTDNGISFTESSNGIALSGFIDYLYDDGTRLFALVNDTVYTSTDNGANWNSSNTGLPNSGQPQELIFDGTDHYLVHTNNIAEVYKSTDDGVTWSLIGTGIPQTYQITKIISVGTDLFVSNGYEIFTSSDGGANWSATGYTNSFTPPNTFIKDLHSDGQNLYVITNRGVYSSNNGGISFILWDYGLSNPSLNSATIYGSTVIVGGIGGLWQRPITEFQVSVSASDSTALVTLYDSTNGDGWSNNSNWKVGPVTSWHGVTIEDPGILSINLQSNNLTGPIPEDFWDINARKINLAYNSNIGGSISPAISNATSLEELRLISCGLTGKLPDEIGDLGNLKYLELSYNSFSDTIPSTFGNLVNLEHLKILGSGLSGSVPPELFGLSNLEEMEFNSNNLSGPLPPEINGLASIENLNFSNNQLTGVFPNEIFSLTTLKMLDLSYNQLDGQLSDQISNLTSLTYLDLTSTQITGPIPTQIGQIPVLTTLNLASSQFTGSIPPEIGNLSNLSTLSISGNRLMGSIPTEIESLTNLNQLSIGGDSLSTEIPLGLLNLPNLSSLRFSGKGFSGSIPPEIGNLTSLNSLTIGGTNISGSIPEEIANLTNLTQLNLDRNQLSGTVPQVITGLTSLGSFRINENEIDSLPDLSAATSIYFFFAINNKLEFSSIVPNVGITGFIYSPQDSIGVGFDSLISEGESVTLEVNTTEANDQLQWHKDGVLIDGATNQQYTITDFTSDDQGKYVCSITNPGAPILTLYSKPFNLSMNPIDLGDRLFVLTADESNSRDTYVNEADPDINYDQGFDNQIIAFGGNHSNPESRAMLLAFDLTELASANVNSNRIDLYFEGLNGYMDAFDYGIYEVTEDWYSDSVTWNSRPMIDSIALDTIYGTDLPTQNSTWFTIQLHNTVVQNWVNNTSENHGIMIIPIADSYGRPNITSSQNTYNSDFHPRFVINSQGVKVNGTVSDQSTSDNLEGIAVSVYEHTQKLLIQTDTTNASGYYEIDVQVPGTYDIKVDGITGYLPASLDSLIVPEDTMVTSDFIIEPNPNAISGEVSGIWGIGNSPYIVVGDITVPNGDTLIIEPGVEVQYAGRYKLIVNGTLRAIGTEADSIKFTSYDTLNYAKGWGIRFINAYQGQNILSYCLIENSHADNGILGGSADDFGGGAYVSQSRVIIENCHFRNNAALSGGAISVISNYPYYPVIIRKNLISKNLATDGNYIETGAGGIHASGDSIWIESNLILDNKFLGLSGPNREGGGGARITRGAFFVNNLVYGNHAVKGSGIMVYRNGNIYNNIIWGNSGTTNGEQLAIQVNPGETEIQPDLHIHSNNIEDSIIVLDRDYPAGFDYLDGTGNMEVDPEFVDSLNDDYHLQASSPLIDAGNSFIYDSLSNFQHSDYEGLDRLFEIFSVADSGIGNQPLPDIGPYESQSIPLLENLEASFNEYDIVQLTWIENILNETGFEISRAIHPDSTYFILDTLAPETITYNDTLMLVESPLHYQIRTLVAEGFGSYAKVEAFSNIISPTDSLALVALYDSTAGPSWTNNSNWTTGPIDTWHGVTIQNARVVELQLIENNLVGFIPTEIGDLDALQTLDLSTNSELTGELPATIGNLTSLKNLTLSNTKLSGPIPAEIGSLLSLERLNFNGNDFTGSIPDAIGNLSLLQYIHLGYNELTGSIPTSIGNLTNLRELYLFNSQLSGAVPSEIGLLPELRYFFISVNEIDELPDLTGLPNVININVNNNKLDFDDIIPNISVLTNYSPQADIGEEIDTLVNIDSSPVLEANPGGTGNSYTWYKDDVLIDGEVAQTLTLPNVDFSDDGVYHYEATNPNVSGLTLAGAPTILKVSSLERDSLVLKQIYESTMGENWLNADNWESGNLTSWEGVTISNDRVIGVDLSNKNVIGAIIKNITDIANLETVNLSGNSITDIPDMSGLSSLTTLDVSDNLLGFDDLEPNIGISSFEYMVQGPVGDSLNLLLPRGTDYAINFSAPGSSNNYQWKRNGEVLSGVTGTSYAIDSINYQNMGVFTVDVSSDIVNNLTLTSQPMSVLAVDPISFVAIGADGSLLEGGTGRLLKIEEPNTPYDTADIQSPVNGKFTFEIAVLGDYLVSIEPEDTTTYLPTYYERTFLWEEADTIKFRQNLEDTVVMVSVPGATEGAVTFQGAIEADFDSDSRILARRKVKKAGCSLRRRTRSGGGRGEQEYTYELYAYVQSNDDGNFIFKNVESGYYRLNIQYPGIPMDESSFVEFQIGGDGLLGDVIEVSAFITKDGIAVDLVSGLGIKNLDKAIRLYPVPADKQLIVDYSLLNIDNLEIEISNLSGQQLESKFIAKPEMKQAVVETSSLANGIYIVTCKDVSGRVLVAYRVVIQH